MSNFGDNLRRVRSALRLSQSAFGKKIGVSGPTISDWENDVQKPRGSNLLSLLSKFPELSKDFPEYNNISKINSDSAKYIGHVDAWDSNTELDDDEVEVQFFMDVELAAGVGGELALEIQGPKLRFSKSTLRRCGVQAEAAACVKVSGNSMEPRLFDGDVVGVNTLDKKIIDGNTYAINHDGLLRVKRLYRLPGGGVRINSMNGQEYPDEHYTEQEAKSINIVGKVFWHSSIW